MSQPKPQNSPQEWTEYEQMAADSEVNETVVKNLEDLRRVAQRRNVQAGGFDAIIRAKLSGWFNR